MTSGPELFFSYARPPNELGYCGPSQTGQVWRLAEGLVTPRSELLRIASAFHGAWPYLELISEHARLSPLSPAVVEAYWIGNGLLGRVGLHDWGNSVEDRFRPLASSRWPALTAAINAGGLPNHAFHVFCVYPWVGLLRDGYTEPAVEVLDRCRISLGRVMRTEKDEHSVVSSRRLEWVGDHLVESEPSEDLYRNGLTELEPGDMVSLHWGYVCQRLDRRQARALELSHSRHLAIANAELRRARLEPVG